MKTTGKYFTSSPFILTANQKVAIHWAGRPKTLERIEKLKDSFETSSDSTLDLIWANFGSGKTHTLWHLANLLERNSSQNIVLYVEMPEQLKCFIDLYKRIMSRMPIETIAKRIESSDAPAIPDNLRRASRILIHGSEEEKSIVIEWIKGGRPYLRDLKRLTGITRRIEDDELALDIVSGIISALTSHSNRLVILIDDFQRTAHLKNRVREIVLSYVRSLINRHSEYLSLIFAAATRAENSALQLFPCELKTLLGIKPSIALPELSKEEAMQFICERLKFFRPQGYQGKAYAPFGENAIRRVIEFISESEEKLIPRSILQTLLWLYNETNSQGIDELPADTTEQLLKRLFSGFKADGI